MNILLTSVGRRAYMVKFFKDALENEGKIHVCNSNENSVAFNYADASVISPIVYSKEYIPFLKKYCLINKIKIIIPLLDVDVFVLSKHKIEFNEIGIDIVVSNSDVVEICNDKWKTYNFLIANDFETPKTFLGIKSVKKALETGFVKFPIVIKPRFGCGSISIIYVHDMDELECFSRFVERKIDNTYLKYESSFAEEKVIYQEHLEGQEYGADLINDLQGDYKNVVLRKKIIMRSGETEIAQTVRNKDVEEILGRLSKALKHIANMDCDFFIIDNKPYILELNARFGGGYPFSHLSGVNLPKAIIEWEKGSSVDLSLISMNKEIKGYKEICLLGESSNGFDQ